VSVTPPNDPHPTSRAPARGSLAHLYCDDHDFGDEEFLPAVMAACLATHALPLYGLFRRADFFSADRELVAAVAHARTMDEVEAAIDEFWLHPANRRWLRRGAGVRLSTQRLRRFARDYLVFAKAPPPAHPGSVAP